MCINSEPSYTTPEQYAKALKILLKTHSLEEIAQRSGRSITWIRETLDHAENQGNRKIPT